jgi:hypothetical protein
MTKTNMLKSAKYIGLAADHDRFELMLHLIAALN